MSDIKLFYSYSIADEDLRNELEKSLKMLERYDSIRGWNFRAISPGEDWNTITNNELENSDIILLLISRDFLASKYCFDVEFKKAIELNNEGKATVVPVILRQCDWKHEQSPLKNLEAVPTNGRPVTSWENLDDAFYDITQSLKATIEKVKKSKLEKTLVKSSDPEIIENEPLDQIIELFRQEANNLNYNSSKDDFKNYEDLKRKLYSKLIGEIDLKIDNIPALAGKLSDLLFEKIYSSEELDEITIQEIVKFRHSKTLHFWHERKLIANALALSLIMHKKFNRTKANFLIDLITDFEDNVWQTALSGLVLVLIYHQNKWIRFEDFKIRLLTLKEIESVQKGLNVIEAIFRYGFYNKGLFNTKFYSHEFFKSPSNCFLPFYSENQVVQKALDNNITPIDPEYFISYLSKLPFLDSYKYMLCLGLENGTTVQVNDAKKVDIQFVGSVNLAFLFTPFQNILCEFYYFLTKYPKHVINDLFQDNMSITTTKLKNLILNRSTELLLTASSNMEEGKFNEAIIKLNDLIKLIPNHREALWRIAISFLEKRSPDYPQAIANLKKLEDMDCDNHRIILKIAESYFRSKKIKAAEQYYFKALELKPTNRNVLFKLIEYFMETRSWDTALTHIIKAKQTFKDEFHLIGNEGKCYEMLNDFEKAKNAYDQFLIVAPSHEHYQVYEGFSSIFLQLGEYEKSVTYALKALENKPNDVDVLMNVGRNYLFAVPNLTLARKYLGKALRRKKDDDIIYGNLGHLELLEGNEEKAIENYKKFASLCITFKGFECFDLDLNFMVEQGIEKEKYLAIKNQIIAYWNSLHHDDN